MIVDVSESTIGGGRRLAITVTSDNATVAPIGEIRVPLGVRPSAVLEHGWQSWSVVRRCDPADVRPERASLPPVTRSSLTADPSRAGRVVTGDQFLVHDGGVAGWLDGASHLGTIEATDEGLVAVALLDGAVLEPGESRTLAPLWIAGGDPGAGYSEFADHWGEVGGARRSTNAPLGWCSWYEYFADVTPTHVRANASLAAANGFQLVQIDDGYQAAIGDWLEPWPGWEGQLRAVADDIRARGCTAGVWTAPFLVGANSQVFARHPEWVVRDDKGRPLRAMFNPTNWGGWTFALDTTRADVVDWLTATYRALRDVGFEYHKIDFCYAAAMPGIRADQTVTRAAALRRGLDAIRAGIGDDAFLLGCGCPFGPAVGVVDAMRVSADVAPAWEPVHNWPGFAESAPAAINAIKASVLRAPLHRRLWANDPDCVLLRATGTALDTRARAALADVVAGTGCFTLVSDDLARYTDAEWDALARLRALAPKADGTRDIIDPFATSVRVVGNGVVLDADFSDLAASRLGDR